MTTSASAKRSSQRPRPPPQQRGNALIYALLALTIVGMAMAGYMSNQQLAYKTRIGQAEATVLETLRNATNTAISANMTALVSGLPFTVNGRTVEVAGSATEPVWTLDTEDLRLMGYLPSGWTTTTSNVNGAGYRIVLRRSPSACTPALFNCDVDGVVVLDGPILVPGTMQTEGVVIGPILTQLGADGAVSLPASPGPPPTTPAVLRGFNDTWTDLNPVATTPAGVVGVRVGTRSSAWASFVRIGDTRDPNLAGNLTVARRLDVGDTANFRGTATFQAPITANAPLSLANAPLNVLRADGETCVRAEPGGRLSVSCTGVVDAVTGNFAVGTFTTQVNTNTIQVSPGDFLIRNGSTGTLVRVTDAGDMELGGGLTATRTVAAPNLRLNAPVRENDSCLPTTIAALEGGGLAVCSPSGVYRGIMRYGMAGTACAVVGGIGVDNDNGGGLICRGGVWVPVNELSSNFTLMATTTVLNDDIVLMPNCRNTAPSQPLLFLLPTNEMTTGDSFYRSAVVSPDLLRTSNATGYAQGGGWRVSLTDAAGNVLERTNAIAMTYCYYS